MILNSSHISSDLSSMFCFFPAQSSFFHCPFFGFVEALLLLFCSCLYFGLNNLFFFLFLPSSISLCAKFFITHILVFDKPGSLNSLMFLLLLYFPSFVLKFDLLLFLFLILSIGNQFHFVRGFFRVQLFFFCLCFSFAYLFLQFSFLLLLQVLFLLSLCGFFKGLGLLPIELLLPFIHSIVSFFVVDLFG